jgi:hypothetical protein
MRIALRELTVTEAAAAALFPERSESGALLPLFQEDDVALGQLLEQLVHTALVEQQNT